MRTGVLHFFRRGLWATLLFSPLLLFADAPSALAARVGLRGYGKVDGLGDLNNTCVEQAANGSILACSNRGLFDYDGRRFRSLGVQQGLRQGGIIYDLAQDKDTRLYVSYPDALYVSDKQVKNAPVDTTLRFRSVPLGQTYFNHHHYQIVSWTGGLAVIVNQHLLNVSYGASDQPRVEPIGYLRAEQKLLGELTSVRSVRGELWTTSYDGRVCSATPGKVRCFGPSDGLPDVSWADVEAGDEQTVVARSDTTMATIYPMTNRVVVEQLPDQGQWPAMTRPLLGFFRDPLGRLVTQSSVGLIVRTPSGWKPLVFGDSSVAGVVSSAMADRGGQLWIGTVGHGVYRVVGYGTWESFAGDDGLSDNIVWSTARDPAAHLWVATDKALDEFEDGQGQLTPIHVYPGSSFAMTVGPDGRIWASNGTSGLRIFDPSSGQVTLLKVPPIDEMVTSGKQVWIGTELGLFDAKPSPSGPPVIKRASTATLPVSGIAPDAVGGVWFTSGGKLAYRSSNGSTAIRLIRWPRGDFEPLCMSEIINGAMWVGGAGGLYRVRPHGNRIVALTFFGASETLEDTVVAAFADRAGRIWIGTGSGVSVFDGKRWVSADTSSGLVWNDVDQNGISGDADGSIWIATGNGLSHVLRPDTLFDARLPEVNISEASLDGTRLTTRRVGYTTAPLIVHLGTTSYGSEGSITFRYKMLGVDQTWADTSTGFVRYPTAPPGHHKLITYSYDSLSHRASLPVTLDIRMAWPWWRQWWAELPALLAVAGFFYALWRARLHGLLRRQAELERFVAERTSEILAAQTTLEEQAEVLRRQAEALRVQATQDGLTGLLNRTEVQRRLAVDLTAPDATHEVGVALLDIDHFKQVNDKHGHLSGDHVLQEVGKRIREVIVTRNYAGRYGGEEFMVVIDDRDGSGSLQVIDLHARIRDECFVLCEMPVRITCSIGLAWARTGDEWEHLVARADAALYAAKHQGRDMIVEETPARPSASDDGPSSDNLRHDQIPKDHNGD